MLGVGSFGLTEVEVLSKVVIDERRTLTIDDVVRELQTIKDVTGKCILFYSLDSLTFGPSDTLFLPYIWNWAEYLSRRLNAEVLVVYTGTRWHKENRVPEDITRQAGKVRQTIFDAFNDIVGSDSSIVSSDDFVPEEDVEHARRGMATSRFRSDVNRISRNSPYGAGYTLREIAANKTIVDYARKRGMIPVKLSFTNQAADFVAFRRLDGVDYVVRFQLPVQAFGRGTVPYSVPSYLTTDPNAYFLLTDTADRLAAKTNTTTEGELDRFIAMLNMLAGNRRGDTYATAAQVGERFKCAANQAGGYPIGEFIPAVEVGRRF